jgi:IcmF-related N-terminal domain
VKDRELYCPINGVLALIPFGATGGDVEANETAVIIEHDLDAIHQSTRVKCPLVAVVCDLEEAPGGTELLARFPEEQRSRRLGVQFPHIPDCDAAVTPKMIEDGVRWVCQGLIPPLVYRLAHAGKQGRTEEQAELRGNTRLCQFLYEMRRRQKRLTHILTRGICPNGAGPWRLGGCFLAATGADAAHEQGFAGGIFPQLLEMQNSVAWSEDALADDASCKRWTKLGYATLAASVAALLALAVLV